MSGPITELSVAIRHLAGRYYAPSLVAVTGTMMLVPTLPVYLAERIDSLTVVSLVLTAAAMGGLVANIPMGWLIGRIGEQAGYVVGLVMTGVGTAGLALGGPLWVPFVTCLVAGAGQSARLLARQSYARRVLSVAIRGRAMALFGGLGRVSMLLGPLLGGLLGEAIGLRATFAVAGSLVLAAAVMTAAAGRSVSTVAPPVVAQPRQGMAAVVKHHGRTITVAGTGQLGVSMIRFGRFTVVPLYGEAIGLDVADIGFVVAIAGALDLVMFPVAGWLMDNLGRLYAIVPSFVVMSVGLAALGLADSFTGLAVVTLLIGFGNGLGSGTMLTLSTDLAPADNPAEFLGLLRLLADLGRILGPLVVGVVADQIGLAASGVALGIVGASTALLFVVVIGETGRETSDGEPQSTTA